MGISKGLFIDTFYALTLTETADGMGSVTKTWTEGAAFKGRLSSLPINERMSDDKQTVFASHKLFCDYQSLNERQRIRTGTRYFEVNGVVNPSNSNHHIELTLLEIS